MKKTKKKCSNCIYCLKRKIINTIVTPEFISEKCILDGLVLNSTTIKECNKFNEKVASLDIIQKRISGDDF